MKHILSGKHILHFFIYVLIQTLFIKNLVFMDVAFCFVYISFLLLLPIGFPSVLALVIAFVTGLSVDIFYDTLGINAAVCVLFMFFRNRWLKLLTPKGGYENESEQPTISNLGIEWFLRFSLPLIFIFNLAIFFLDAGTFSYFGDTMIKVLSSTVFTSVVILLMQIIFYNKLKVKK